MSTLKQMRREAVRGNKNVITGPHTRWLETPEDEQIYTPEAIEFVSKALRREFKHSRPGRFSPSAMGECGRKVVFGYAGAPQLQPDIDNQEQMDHGSWTHLKWQAEGLTLGYMTEAEVWQSDEETLSGGSMDAELEDGSIFELKSAGWNIYNRVVNVDGWPKWENLLQVHDYFILSGAAMASVVYENRSSGAFHEFRVPRDSRIEAEVLRRLASYKAYVEADELPPMLDMCEKRLGTTYKRCPYRDLCYGSKSVSQFGVIT